jgi:hypothetical protein
MSALESRYRRALVWYPVAWREQNADIVVGTLMDEADATGRTVPRATELLNLAANGVRTRLAVAHGWVHPRAFSRLSDIAFAFGFVLSLVMLVGFEWAPWAPQIDPGYGIGFGPLVTSAAALEIVWLLAFAAALTGFARTSSILLGVAAVVAVAIAVLRPVLELALAPSATFLAFMAVLAIIALGGRSSSGRVPLLLSLTGASIFVALVLAITPKQLSNEQFFPDRLMSFGVTTAVVDSRLFALGFIALIAVAAVARSRPWLHSGIIGLTVCLEAALLVPSADYNITRWLLYVVLPNAIAIAATLVVVRRRARVVSRSRR